MNPSPWSILDGCALARLAELPAGRFQTCVSSPPYWMLRSYLKKEHPLKPLELGQEKTPDCFGWATGTRCGACYVCRMTCVFREVRRVLRNDGTLWLNVAGSYANGGNGGNEKTHKGEHKGRRDPAAGWKAKDFVNVPALLAESLRADGWYLRAEVALTKVAPMPESCRDRPTRATEKLYLFAKSGRYYYDGEAERAQAQDWGQRDRTNWKINDADRAGQPPHKGGTDCDFAATGRNLWDWWDTTDDDLPAPFWVWRPEPSKVKHYACVDADTECLTAEGWKRHDRIKAGDVAAQFDLDGETLSWGVVEDVATYNVVDEPMVSVKHLNANILLTPNHRTIVRRRLRDGYSAPSVIRADELKGGHQIPVAAPWPDQEGAVGIGKDWAELLGWYVAEGHENKAGWGVDIYQSVAANADKVERIRRLLGAVGAEYRFAIGPRVWKGRDASLAAFNVMGYAAARLRELAPGKRLGWHVLDWPLPDLRALFDGLIDGDGHRRKDDGRIVFVQKDKDTIDLVQAVAVRLGYATKQRVRVSKGGTYQVRQLNLSDKTSVSLRGTNGGGKAFTMENYTGVVWCPKLPRGTWVARKDGRVFITGNTFPLWLPLRCIRLGTSAMGCCAACGMPLRRVVERKTNGAVKVCPSDEAAWQARREGQTRGMGDDPVNTSGLHGQYLDVSKQTTGWRRPCRCPEAPPVPCAVLDPFAGTATVGVAARLLGRTFTGVELNPEYAAMARARLADAAPLDDAAFARAAAAPTPQPDLFGEEPS